MSKKTKGGGQPPPCCPTKFCRYTVFTDKNYIRISLDKIKELYSEAEKSKMPLKIAFSIPINNTELFYIEGIVTKEKRN
jgi:hypothetical protein